MITQKLRKKRKCARGPRLKNLFGLYMLCLCITLNEFRTFEKQPSSQTSSWVLILQLEFGSFMYLSFVYSFVVVQFCCRLVKIYYCIKNVATICMCVFFLLLLARKIISCKNRINKIYICIVSIFSSCEMFMNIECSTSNWLNFHRQCFRCWRMNASRFSNKN